MANMRSTSAPAVPLEPSTSTANSRKPSESVSISTVHWADFQGSTADAGPVLGPTA